MEAQLREYRALRRRKELIEKAKQELENTKEKAVNFLVPNIFHDMSGEKNEEEALLMDEEPQPQVNIPLIQPEDPCDVTSEVDDVELSTKPNQESWKYFIVKWSLYCVIWISLFMYFIMIKFGAVFFTVSLLIGIYLNTRTRPKKDGEVSAYSVFNQNCQSINGTLNAEDLQKQMLYGVVGLR